MPKKIAGRFYKMTVTNPETYCTACGRHIRRGAKAWAKYAGVAVRCGHKDRLPVDRAE